MGSMEPQSLHWRLLSPALASWSDLCPDITHLGLSAPRHAYKSHYQCTARLEHGHADRHHRLDGLPHLVGHTRQHTRCLVSPKATSEGARAMFHRVWGYRDRRNGRESGAFRTEFVVLALLESGRPRLMTVFFIRYYFHLDAQHR